MMKRRERRWQAVIQIRETTVEGVLEWRAVDLIEPGGRSVK
jgi:hypothetical protein